MSEKFSKVTCFITFCYMIAITAGASFITKCKSNDTKCAKASTKAAIPVFLAGIPELGIEAMDPLYYKKIDASSNDLKLFLSDLTITGLKSCEPKKVQRDIANSKLLVRALCTINVDGDYEVGGRILILPIEGKGKAHVVLNKILINVEGDMGERIDKDGVKHWDVKAWRHSYELKDKAEIDLTNLFDGNEELSRAIRALLASNANDVLGEVAPPIVKAILSKVVKIINHFFHKVPAEDLILE